VYLVLHGGKLVCRSCKSPVGVAGLCNEQLIRLPTWCNVEQRTHRRLPRIFARPKPNADSCWPTRGIVHRCHTVFGSWIGRFLAAAALRGEMHLRRDENPDARGNGHIRLCVQAEVSKGDSIARRDRSCAQCCFSSVTVPALVRCSASGWERAPNRFRCVFQWSAAPLWALRSE